jgi:hypothetical protein
VSEPAWSRVGEAFHEADVEWTVVEVAEGGDEVRVVPRIRIDALQGRFDRLLGVGGWSVSYAPLGGDAVACHLVIDGVTKGAVAAPALVGGGAATAAVALNLAAARFGVRPHWPDGASAWVACDPETFEPLHAPEAPAATLDTGTAPLVRPLQPGAEARAFAMRRGAPTVSAPTVSAPAVSAPAEATPTPAAAPKAEGQQIIDRLIERLKAEGQGLAAARILVRHGGYGKDPQAARELYGELRDLLRAIQDRDPESAGPA